MRVLGLLWLLVMSTLGVAGGADAAASATDAQIRSWEARLERDPYDSLTPANLGDAYARKARESGDPTYYRRAERALGVSLERAPENYAALSTLARVYVGQHRFREARALAERCINLEPTDAGNYGALGDANVELGEYDAAAKAFQRMLEMEPGLSAYARASYLQELHGKRKAAIERMRMAAEAAKSGDLFNRAWCRTQLGDVYFREGRLEDARLNYDAAIELFPGYYLALVGKARVAAARKQFDEAERLLTQAIAVIPRPEFIAALGDLYGAAGQKKEAGKQYDLVVQIERVNIAAGAPDNRRLSLFYSNHDRDLAAALSLAQKEYALRHDVYTCDALAWALYKNGRFVEGWEMAERAMRLHTDDAGILYHAGMIGRRIPGRSEEARRLLKQALTVNPYFDLRQAPIARRALTAPGAGRRRVAKRPS